MSTSQVDHVFIGFVESLLSSYYRNSLHMNRQLRTSTGVVDSGYVDASRKSAKSQQILGSQK